MPSIATFSRLLGAPQTHPEPVPEGYAFVASEHRDIAPQREIPPPVQAYVRDCRPEIGVLVPRRNIVVLGVLGPGREQGALPC